MTDRRTRDKAEIRTLIAKWSRAVEAKDPDAIVEAYTPDTVLFDAIPPYCTIGAQAIKEQWERCLPYFPARFRSEHKDVAITVEGDLAVLHALHHFVPETPDHPCGASWMRVTACYRRIDGRWRVAHEHVSVPFDPMSGKAALIADPQAPGESGEVPAPAALPAIHPVTPHLVCAGAAAAIDFYSSAFGARELMRLAGPDGKLMHALLEINGSSVMLVDEHREMGNAAPTSLGGTPVTLHLTVPDVDGSTARAIAAGAKVILPVADMFWGDRYGIIEDPFGHRWSLATPKRAMTLAQIEQAAQDMPCGRAQH
jgi:PhnB protein